MHQYKVKLNEPFDPYVDSYLYTNDIFVHETTEYGEDIVIISTFLSREELQKQIDNEYLFDIKEIIEDLI